MAEQKQIATIFNNVMGPVGTGPSTSNTCGPCRIAYLSGKLAGGPVKKAKVIFPADSGYATPNGKGMRSDYAFAFGLLGRLPDAKEPLLEAFDDLKKAGIELSFAIDDKLTSSGEHLLDVMELTGEDGRVTTVHGLSKGGGIIEIIRIDGFSVSIGGESNLLLVFMDKSGREAEAAADKLKAACPALAEYPTRIAEDGAGSLILFPTYEFPSQQMIETAGALDGVIRTVALPSILPVVVKPHPALPYGSAAELEAYCGASGKSLPEAAIAYEQAVSGWSRERIRGFAADVVKAMRRAVEKGREPGLTFDGIIEPTAARLTAEAAKGVPIADGIVTKAAIYSLAVMEYSNASGVVVCMPTAGASGVIAAALLAAAEQLRSSDEQIVDALLAAGGVGVSISEDNDFCGGVYGCQAEVGCASSIAAAGLVILAGGTAKMAMNAASMALQNMLGLICDPVCGLVQVPCFSRNMSAVANAVVCANMSMLGFPAVVSLQGAFEAMKCSGSCLPTSLRGCGGGLADTPEGRQLLEQYFKDK